MTSCGSFSNKRAIKVQGIMAVGLIVNSNGGVELALLRAEYLGTLKMGTTSTTFVPAFEVKVNLLQKSGITSTSKLEFFLLGPLLSTPPFIN